MKVSQSVCPEQVCLDHSILSPLTVLERSNIYTSKSREPNITSLFIIKLSLH